jgi:hypothetical protein
MIVDVTNNYVPAISRPQLMLGRLKVVKNVFNKRS